MCGCVERRAALSAGLQSGDPTAIKQAVAFVVSSTMADIAAAAKATRAAAGRRLGLTAQGR